MRGSVWVAVPDPADQLAAYRERHVIRPVSEDGRDWPPPECPVCVHDRLPVIRRRGGWRHHPDAVRSVARVERERWPR